MKFAAIHFKNNAAGLRCFSDEKAAIQAGENPANLHSVDGVFIKWPAALGAPPTSQDIVQWETEYDAHIDLEGKRLLALKAAQDAALEAMLNDPNAPQAVKDYKASKK